MQSLCWWILSSLIFVLFHDPTTAQLEENGFRPSIPTYFVDPNLIKIAMARFRSCGVHFVNDNQTIFAVEELAYLSTKSASEYFRGHELLAYHYFVENKENNPHYRQYINEAELEYIPIVPLAWRTYKSGCSYSTFISMLLKFHEYLSVRDVQVMEAEPSMVLPRRFFVASSFNMRTQWGTGMPTPYRRGAAWEAMSAFIQTLSVGHYERWPECPDLLRKWWKYAVELPFLTINSVGQLTDMSLFPKDFDRTLNYTYLTQVTKLYLEKQHFFQAMNSLPIAPVPQSKKDREEQKWFSILNQEDDNPPPLSAESGFGKKQYTFLFAGHFELPGPDLVCSTRNNILNLHYERSDLLLINMTNADSYRKPVLPILAEYMKRSVFCIISPGDSYSSSFFYHAIANGCIPIVINDWFVFAFPWLLHYESFVLRISENDFNLNPSYVFDTIKEHYFQPNPYLIRSMQRMMKYMTRYLTWSRIQYMTDEYYDLLSADVHYFTRNNRFGLLDTFDGDAFAEKQFSFVPLELLMLELRYESLQHNYYQNVPCMRPLWCNHDYQSNATWIPKLPNPWSPPKTIDSSIVSTTTIDDSFLPKSSHISSTLFPPNTKVLPFQLSVLKRSFERYRGMSWSIFPNSPSPASIFASKEKGWWVQEGDFFQVHALYIPPPSTIFAPDGAGSSQGLTGVPDLYYKTNKQGQRQLGVLSTTIPDRRSYLCFHRPRLIGNFKIVFFMQCVRVLWTLNPGKFKPRDNVQRFTSASVPIPGEDMDNNDMLSREEYDFTLAFHNISSHPQPHWIKENYPLAYKHHSYYSFNRSEEVRVRKLRESLASQGRDQLQRIFTIRNLVENDTP